MPDPGDSRPSLPLTKSPPRYQLQDRPGGPHGPGPFPLEEGGASLQPGSHARGRRRSAAAHRAGLLGVPLAARRVPSEGSSQVTDPLLN